MIGAVTIPPSLSLRRTCRVPNLDQTLHNSTHFNACDPTKPVMQCLVDLEEFLVDAGCEGIGGVYGGCRLDHPGLGRLYAGIRPADHGAEDRRAERASLG